MILEIKGDYVRWNNILGFEFYGKVVEYDEYSLLIEWQKGYFVTVDISSDSSFDSCLEQKGFTIESWIKKFNIKTRN